MIRESLSGPGRPRAPGHDEKIIEATLHLIDTSRKITVSEIVKLSGVSRAAVYRRWPSLTDLIATALDQGRNYPDVDVNGSIREILAETFFVHPDETRGGDYPLRRFRKRMELIMAEPDLQQAYWKAHVNRRRKNLIRALIVAQERGEIRADVDVEAALDGMIGAFYYQLVVRGETFEDPDSLRRCYEVFDLLWRGMQ